VVHARQTGSRSGGHHHTRSGCNRKRGECAAAAGRRRGRRDTPRRRTGTEVLIPPTERYGLKIMSAGFIIAEDQPLILDGGSIQFLIHQLVRGVDWGELGAGWGAPLGLRRPSDPGLARGGSLAAAVADLVAGGVSTADALASATSVAARACGLGERKGRLRTGYDADLVLVEGDPTVDIGSLRHVAAVMVRGKWVDGTATGAASRSAR